MEDIVTEIHEIEQPPTPDPPYQFLISEKEFTNKFFIDDTKILSRCSYGIVFMGLNK